MGVMKTLNTMRMFGQNISQYERRLGLVESKPEPEDVDQQLLLWVDEEEPLVLED